MSNYLRVYFDARMLGFSGIGMHIEEVLERLLMYPEIKMILLGDPKKIKNYFPVQQFEWIPFSSPIYSLQEQIFFPDMKKGKGIYHIPHYNAPIRKLSQSIVVVHDLIHLDSEEFRSPHYRFYARFLLKQIVKKAKIIITVSEYTKTRLLQEFPEAQTNIIVNYNGINRNYFYPATKKEIIQLKRKYNLPDKFLLVIGIGKKHKNLDTLLIALKELWIQKKIDIPLVIGGTNQNIPSYVRGHITNEITPFLYWLPYLPKKELRILYSSALCFIMPSKLEGFGFPLLEAMACGTPTISSHATSLSEIGGNATYYFDPYSVEEIKNAIVSMIDNSQIRKKLVQKGLKRVQNFSWESHVKKLIDIYKNIL